MRRAWWIVGCLAGCSTVAPLADTGDTEAVSDGAEGTTVGAAGTAPTGGEAGTGAAPTTSAGESGGTDVEPGTGTADTTGEAPVLPEACDGVAVPTGPEVRMLEVQGTLREYMVVTPASYDATTPLALVFAWHGRGGDGSGARLYFGVEQASAGAAIVVYPDGLPQADMMDQTGWDLTAEGEDVAFFDAMLADVQATRCVDAGRVFSTGHSFGGFMSNALGCFRGGTIRAIAPVAGGGPFGRCSGQVAAWIAHGTLDEVVPFMFGEGSRDHWTAANGCDATTPTDVDPAPCVAYAGCDDGLPVHWCAHDIPDFSGHTWPAWAGKAIWAFFAGL